MSSSFRVDPSRSSGGFKFQAGSRASASRPGSWLLRLKLHWMRSGAGAVSGGHCRIRLQTISLPELSCDCCGNSNFRHEAFRSSCRRLATCHERFEHFWTMQCVDSKPLTLSMNRTGRAAASAQLLAGSKPLLQGTSLCGQTCRGVCRASAARRRKGTPGPNVGAAGKLLRPARPGSLPQELSSLGEP